MFFFCVVFFLMLRPPPRFTRTDTRFPTRRSSDLRVRIQHPQLSEARALFVAHGWGAEDGKGRVRLQADPRHRLNMPGLFRAEESMAIWREVRAPTLFIDRKSTRLNSSH